MSGLRILLVIVLTGSGASLTAQDVDERLQTMSTRVQDLALVMRGTSREIHVEPQPLLRYSSPNSTTTDGTVWAWLADGRPVALTAVFLDSRPDFLWNYECVALTNEPFTVRSPRDWYWAPTKQEHHWRSLETKAPAATPTGRLIQMRNIVRKFSGSQDLDGNKGQYRLMPQPVLRYSAEDKGIIDGALFILADGTNPEIVLQLEATTESSPWRIALSRLSAAALRASYEDKPFWEIGRVVSWHPSDAYFSHYGADE